MSEIQDEAYTELCAENEHLKFLLQEERETINQLAKLLVRAADALEDCRLFAHIPSLALIDELREAADTE